jgi:VWFA-related protein
MRRFFGLPGVLLPGALFMALPVAIPGQNSPTLEVQRPATVQPSGAEREVTLEVQVTDKSGAPIRGLQKENFTVRDDKQPQKILSFQAVDMAATTAADPPPEIILVVDAVNTSFFSNSYEREALRNFLLQNGGKLPWPVSFIFVSEGGPQILNRSTRDGNALVGFYDQYDSGLKNKYLNRGGGRWGASERIQVSLNALSTILTYEKTRAGRKLMLWFSRGWPMLSESNVHLTSNEQQRLYANIAAVSTALREGHITLYSIDPGGLGNTGTIRDSYYESFLKGVTSPSRAEPGDLGLQVLAVQSGGRVFKSSNDLGPAIRQCAADADACYLVSFSGARADQANEYHSLAITVDKPGAVVRTRAGYYAQP